MIKIILFFFIALFMTGFEQKSENVLLVKSFEKHYNEKNEKEILELISDDFIISYQDQFTEIDGKDAFVVVLKWGRIMNAKNETTIISEYQDQVVTSEKYTNDQVRLARNERANEVQDWRPTRKATREGANQR